MINLTVTSVAGSTSGSTVITVEPILTSGNSYKYKVADTPTLPTAGQVISGGYANWDGTSEITAASGKKIVVVEVDSSSRCVGMGVATVAAAE